MLLMVITSAFDQGSFSLYTYYVKGNCKAHEVSPQAWKSHKRFNSQMRFTMFGAHFVIMSRLNIGHNCIFLLL